MMAEKHVRTPGLGHADATPIRKRCVSAVEKVIDALADESPHLSRGDVMAECWEALVRRGLDDEHEDELLDAAPEHVEAEDTSEYRLARGTLDGSNGRNGKGGI